MKHRSREAEDLQRSMAQAGAAFAGALPLREPKRPTIPTVLFRHMGELDPVAQLARDMFLKYAGEREPESCYEQAIEFFHRVELHRQKLDALLEEQKKAAQEPTEPPQSPIIIP